MSISKIAILGGGQMGSGIAQVAAAAGIDVVMIKATPGPADKARASRFTLAIAVILPKSPM